MSRLSLTDWYRYLESQFADDAPEPQSPESPTEASAQSPPTTPQPPAEPPQPAVRVGEPLPNSEPTAAPPIATEMRRDALVSIRVPDFAEFVPLIEQEVGRKPSAAPAPRAEPAPTPAPTEPAPASSEPPSDGPRLRKRRGRNKRAPETVVPPEADELWAKLPQYLRYLAEWTDDGVTRKYYPVRGRDESREELIARLTDPVLTLEETARLLGVCPATVRRYTDRGWLRCFRTEGNQRRFHLSDIVAFLEEQALRQPRGNRNAHRESEAP
jgi:excisionase family DNA binding protein